MKRVCFTSKRGYSATETKATKNKIGRQPGEADSFTNGWTKVSGMGNQDIGPFEFKRERTDAIFRWIVSSVSPHFLLG